MLGFELIKSSLLTSHNNNKLHHAILLHGKKGMGKATFAKSLVHEILNQENLNPENHETSPEKHPDILLIEKEAGKKEISVDKIRKISKFLNQTSAISKYKFILIDAADELNKSSSNALLKILEEPHSNNFLILVSHNPNKVLPTIKSRCQIVTVPDLSYENFVKILEENDPEISEDEISILSELCDNSPAKAINHGEGLIDLYQLFLTSLKNRIIDDKIYKKLSDKSFSFDMFIEIIEFFLNRLIRFLSNGEMDFYFEEEDIFLNIQKYYSLERIFSVSENSKKSLIKVKSLNSDKKLAFVNIFNNLIKTRF